MIFFLFTLLMVAVASAAPQQKSQEKVHIGMLNAFKPAIGTHHPSASGRIVNGQIAKPHSFPYQAFLQMSNENKAWYCSGSLISSKLILTSGHCGHQASVAVIILGAQKPLQDEDSQLTLQSRDIIIHSKFNDEKILYDISLIQLTSTIVSNAYISTIRLPTRSDIRNTYEGTIAQVAGWGTTSGDSNVLSEELRFVKNPVLSNKVCNATFGVIQDYQICLSGKDGFSACRGDTGGPLSVDGVQIGIVSFGATKCPNGYPSVYTRVTSFLDWIQENSK